MLDQQQTLASSGLLKIDAKNSINKGNADRKFAETLEVDLTKWRIHPEDVRNNARSL